MLLPHSLACFWSLELVVRGLDDHGIVLTRLIVTHFLLGIGIALRIFLGLKVIIVSLVRLENPAIVWVDGL